MKKIISSLFAMAILMSQSKGQNISPNENQEYCPNTNYNFVVTVPGSITSISPSGGCSVVSTLANGFTGSFADVNAKQTFTIYYTDINGAKLNYTFNFKKVKSLFSDACSTIPLSAIIAPFCQTTDIQYSFTALQWYTTFESPKFCFGSINTYEYLLPSGWKLNSTLSNGSNWLPASNNVIFTPDAATGGIIQVRAINGDCTPTSIFKGQITSITISRPGPAFSLSPTSVQVQCGTSQTQTYNVSMAGATACPVSYLWNLGSNNGWLYNGSPAPTTPFVAPASITLTSLANISSIANVTVTPVLNGTNQTTLTSVSTLAKPSFSISGQNSMCISSDPYSIPNLPTGATVTWTATPAGVVTINTPNATQTTLTKISKGSVVLNATIHGDQCINNFSTSRKIIVGDPPTDNFYISQVIPSCQGTIVAPCTFTAIPYANESISGYTFHWSYVYNGVTYSIPGTGSSISKKFTGLGMYQILVWAQNNCGSTDEISSSFNLNSCTGSRMPHIQSSNVIVSPNPAKSNIKIEVAQNEIQEIQIVDEKGVICLKKQLRNGIKSTVIPMNNFVNGIYWVRIFDGEKWTTKKTIIQH